MNQFALRLFVRSLINEAKEKKVEKEPKKSIKKEEKAPKSSGKLVDLKKELAALKQMRDELQMAKFAEKTASTEVEFADLKKFAAELDKIKAGGVKLEQEIDNKIDDLETRISDEKNKIKEMMGLTPEAKNKKNMMGEKKEEKSAKKENIHNTAQMGGVTTSKGTAGYVNKPDNQKGGGYDPKQRAANLAKLKDFGPKKK